MDVTNYVMFDLNRPMHAYDAEKIDKEIIVRNAKAGEVFEGLDDKQYKLRNDMCNFRQNWCFGIRRSYRRIEIRYKFTNKTILLELKALSHHHLLEKLRENLNIETDAKYRFERGVDPSSIEDGLKIAADLIINILAERPFKFNFAGKKLLKEVLNLIFISLKKL